jgi:hypothetical protein
MVVKDSPTRSGTNVIKDKPFDIGLIEITNKQSCMEAKNVINAWLHCPPNCPDKTSKALITMPKNQTANL